MMGEKFSEDCLNPDCGEFFIDLAHADREGRPRKEMKRLRALYNELRGRWIQIGPDSFVRVGEATPEQWEANDVWRDRQALHEGANGH
jgi:hypothetical protein